MIISTAPIVRGWTMKSMQSMGNQAYILQAIAQGTNGEYYICFSSTSDENTDVARVLKGSGLYGAMQGRPYLLNVGHCNGAFVYDGKLYLANGASTGNIPSKRVSVVSCETMRIIETHDVSVIAPTGVFSDGEKFYVTSAEYLYSTTDWSEYTLLSQSLKTSVATSIDIPVDDIIGQDSTYHDGCIYKCYSLKHNGTSSYYGFVCGEFDLSGSLLNTFLYTSPDWVSYEEVESMFFAYDQVFILSHLGGKRGYRLRVINQESNEEDFLVAINAINKIFQEGEFTATDFAVISEICTKHDDGVVSGCEISGSGTILSCTSGYCLVHGRLIEIEGGTMTVESVSATTTKYLILEVDLARDNSTRLFIDSSINHPDDDDFNEVQGKAYMWLAKFTIGANGITSTVSKPYMPKARQIGTVSTIDLGFTKKLSKSNTYYELFSKELSPGNYLVKAYAYIGGISGGTGTSTLKIECGDLSRVNAAQHSVNNAIVVELSQLINVAYSNDRNYKQTLKISAKSTTAGRNISTAQMQITRLG